MTELGIYLSSQFPALRKSPNEIPTVSRVPSAGKVPGIISNKFEVLIQFHSSKEARLPLVVARVDNEKLYFMFAEPFHFIKQLEMCPFMCKKLS